MRIFLLLLLLIPQFCSSQEIKKPKTFLKINATNLFDFFAFPTFQLQLEQKVGAQTALALEAGIQPYDFRIPDTTILSFRGYKLNAEFRYYFDETDNLGFYISGQPFFRANRYTGRIHYETSDTTSSVDLLGVKKQCFGLNGIFGFHQQIFNILTIDLYAGAGMMRRIIKNTNREFMPPFHSYYGSDVIATGKRHLASDRTVANFTFGIRIGYGF